MPEPCLFSSNDNDEEFHALKTADAKIQASEKDMNVYALLP
jgi:hypothetical protein